MNSFFATYSLYIAKQSHFEMHLRFKRIFKRKENEAPQNMNAEELFWNAKHRCKALAIKKTPSLFIKWLCQRSQRSAPSVLQVFQWDKMFGTKI